MATVATVQISESNGAGPTVTNNISNINMGSIEAVNLDYTNNPIVANNNSYEKWIRIYLSALGTSNKIDNFQIWMTPAPSVTGITYYSNVTSVGPGGTGTYTQPTTGASTIASLTMKTSDPTLNNLGPSAGLNTAGSHSQYAVFQLRTTGASPPGNLPQKTFHFQYDEQ